MLLTGFEPQSYIYVIIMHHIQTRVGDMLLCQTKNTKDQIVLRLKSDVTMTCIHHRHPSHTVARRYIRLEIINNIHINGTCDAKVITTDKRHQHHNQISSDAEWLSQTVQKE